MALVMSDNGTFAHIVYSKLNTNKNAVVNIYYIVEIFGWIKN